MEIEIEWHSNSKNPTSYVSFPLSWGRWPSLIRQNRWLWCYCESLTLLQTRQMRLRPATSLRWAFSDGFEWTFRCAAVTWICPRLGVPSSPTATLTKTRRSSANSCQNCVLRRAAQEDAHEKELLEPNADAAHDENELPNKKELQREGAASRALPTISFGGVWCS